MARDVLAIVPAFRNPAQLARCRAHLDAQTVASRIATYVRDNSIDNVLYTAAINEGLRHGLADRGVRYFLLLNQDCYLEPDAVERLVAHFDAAPGAGICAPIQLSPDDPNEVVWGGAHAAFPAGVHIGGPVRLFRAPAEVPWATGAAMMVRREVVEDIGLLDANLRMLCSDADYCFSARARGWRVMVVPTARCRHRFNGSSLGGAAEDVERAKNRDVAYFADKWITGELYRRLSAEGETMDLDALRELRARFPE